jgi:peroxiredoxin
LNFGPLLAAGLLAAAPVQNANGPSHAANTVQSDTVASVAAPSAPPAGAHVPASGEPAPDFTYQSRDYLWQNLHNMLEQGSVLLVFGASDELLRGLEGERERLVHAGVLPVAVIQRRDDAVWNVVRRNGLTYSLLADPRAVIAEQYGVVDPATHAARTTWFVVDRSCHVRASGEGAPRAGGWLALAYQALGHTDVEATGAH